MGQAEIGIIGGTGLGEVLEKEANGTEVTVDTPFGPPSGVLIVANWEGVDVAFLSRHGPGHTLNPSQVPYRANIWAMKKLGVSGIIASGATGSLREEIEPGHLVVCDQVIDKTFRRDGTFFDQGPVTHVELANPFCERLRAALLRAGETLPGKIHDRGTYVCMEGPQFSTRAESHMHRAWGGDLIGMTCMPEAKLAREAELCYALIALPTDYDCWRPSDPDREGDELLKEILGNLNVAAQNAISLIRATLAQMKEPSTGKQVLQVACRCHDALKMAIWSDKSKIDPNVKKRLEPLVGRYL